MNISTELFVLSSDVSIGKCCRAAEPFRVFKDLKCVTLPPPP